MNTMTLKQLRYVEALAQHQHFGQAAAACAISQPALSMQIKELEASLGVQLFERSARHVRLTALGEAFAARAQEILRAVDDLEALARVSQQELWGRFRLGVIPTIAPYLLPQVMGDLSARFPNMELQVRETLTARLLDDLADGRLDAALVALPVSEASLEEVPLFSEGFVLVRPASDAGRPVPTMEALPAERLLLLEEGHCFRDQALAVCGLGTAAPRDGLDGSSLSTLVQLVGAGLGITLLPAMATEVETRGAGVTVDAFGPGAPARTVGLVWRKTNPMAARLRDVAEIVREAAETVYDAQRAAR